MCLCGTDERYRALVMVCITAARLRSEEMKMEKTGYAVEDWLQFHILAPKSQMRGGSSHDVKMQLFPRQVSLVTLFERMRSTLKSRVGIINRVSCVEAGSNTSTVALRLVGGGRKGKARI
jgi:hypothetical protein